MRYYWTLTKVIDSGSFTEGLGAQTCSVSPPGICLDDPLISSYLACVLHERHNKEAVLYIQ